MLRLLFLALLVVSLSACDSTRRWTEDVLLSNGSTTVVERSLKIAESNALGGGAYSARVRLSTLKFTGDRSQLPAWSVKLLPQVLYEDELTGEWVIVANSSECEVYFERAHPRFWFAPGRPQTAYFEFRLRDSRWVQVPLSVSSIGRPTNLHLEYNLVEDSHLTIAAKARLLGHAAEEYRSILEAPQPNCMRTTYTQPIWDAEDRTLEALDRENATSEQRTRVGELFAGTRFVRVRRDYLARDSAFSWAQDSDPLTVEMLVNTGLNQNQPGVSTDGQVIYVPLSRSVDTGELLKQSYARRLEAAGLGRFAE